MRITSICLSLGLACAWGLSAGTLLPATAPPDGNFNATVSAGPNIVLLIGPISPEPFVVLDDQNNVLSAVAGVTSPDGQAVIDVNAGSSEAVALAFNMAGAQVSGTNLLIPAVGTGVTPLTDPGLQALVGNSLFVFSQDATKASQFDFMAAALPATASGVPEPAVAFTVGLGLFAISALRFRKRAS